MSNVKIKKVKLKDDLFLEVEFSEDLPGHNKKDTRLSSTIPVHEDLKNAIHQLNKHLAIICDEVPCPKSKHSLESADFEKFAAKGFSIGGNDENEGVTISGQKDGHYGIVNLNTPFQKFEASDYKYIGELAAEIETCVYEVEQYLFEGKRAPEAQLAMFDEDDFNDDLEEVGR